jgi:hypothetical protein
MQIHFILFPKRYYFKIILICQQISGVVVANLDSGELYFPGAQNESVANQEKLLHGKASDAEAFWPADLTSEFHQSLKKILFPKLVDVDLVYFEKEQENQELFWATEEIRTQLVILKSNLPTLI